MRYESAEADGNLTIIQFARLQSRTEQARVFKPFGDNDADVSFCTIVLNLGTIKASKE